MWRWSSGVVIKLGECVCVCGLTAVVASLCPSLCISSHFPEVFAVLGRFNHHCEIYAPERDEKFLRTCFLHSTVQCIDNRDAKLNVRPHDCIINTYQKWELPAHLPSLISLFDWYLAATPSFWDRYHLSTIKWVKSFNENLFRNNERKNQTEETSNELSTKCSISCLTRFILQFFEHASAVQWTLKSLHV